MGHRLDRADGRPRTRTSEELSTFLGYPVAIVTGLRVLGRGKMRRILADAFAKKEPWRWIAAGFELEP
jgi:hypothetical protein